MVRVPEVEPATSNIFGTSDALDFTKIHDEKFTMESIQMSPYDLLFDVLKCVTPTARDHGVELIGFVSKNVPNILMGDPVRIRQILLTLCSQGVMDTYKEYLHVRIEVLSSGRETTIPEALAESSDYISGDASDSIVDVKRNDFASLHTLHSCYSEDASVATAIISDKHKYCKLTFTIEHRSGNESRPGKAPSFLLFRALKCLIFWPSAQLMQAEQNRKIAEDTGARICTFPSVSSRRWGENY
jgi:hypothetical protein